MHFMHPFRLDGGAAALLLLVQTSHELRSNLFDIFVPAFGLMLAALFLQAASISLRAYFGLD